MYSTTHPWWTVVPIIRADKSLDPADVDHIPRNDFDKMAQECCKWCMILPQSENQSLDDSEIYHGAPAGLQFIGRRFEEEEMLALAKLLDSLIQRNEATSVASNGRISKA